MPTYSSCFLVRPRCVRGTSAGGIHRRLYTPPVVYIIDVPPVVYTALLPSTNTTAVADAVPSTTVCTRNTVVPTCVYAVILLLLQEAGVRLVLPRDQRPTYILSLIHI